MNRAQNVVNSIGGRVVSDNQFSVLGIAQTQVVEIRVGFAVCVCELAKSLLRLEHEVGDEGGVLNCRHLNGVVRVGLDGDSVEVDDNVPNHAGHFHELIQNVLDFVFICLNERVRRDRHCYLPFFEIS